MNAQKWLLSGIAVVGLALAGCGHKPVASNTTATTNNRHVDGARAIDNAERKTDELPHTQSSGEKQAADVNSPGAQVPGSAQPTPTSAP